MGNSSQRQRHNGVCIATGFKGAISITILEPHLCSPRQQDGNEILVIDHQRAGNGTKLVVPYAPNTEIGTCNCTDSPKSVEKLNNNFKLALASQDRGHLVTLPRSLKF